MKTDGLETKISLRAVFFLGLCLAPLASCAHANRVSRRALERLAKKGEPYVLVFGSVTTPRGMLARPVIRFVYPASRSAPEYVLRSLIVSSGNRFYAVLQTPPAAAYLDEFYTEIGSAETGLDKIAWVRLPRSDTPLAMYVGEISITPAQKRTAQGQTVVVRAGDDFQNAQRELKRRYPGFDGTFAKVSLSLSPVPMQAPPGRVR